VVPRMRVDQWAKGARVVLVNAWGCRRVRGDEKQSDWRPCDPCHMDLEVGPALTIPAAELRWRFSRSSGPGGQHLNTSDSRVQLTWSPAGSLVLTNEQRARILQRLSRRMVQGAVTVTVSEQRSQLRNRVAALAALREIVADALAPDAVPRRPTRPTKGSQRRRLATKTQQAAKKQQRKRPTGD
jgi:ribosome-associated protein